MEKSHDAPRGRLGIYVDDVYRLEETIDGPRVSTDRAFLLFACEVGRGFDELVLIGRTVDSTEPSDYVLPAHAQLARLPTYANLLSLGQVARAVPGSIAGMWRALGRVDTVWVIGPNPFDILLIAFAVLRRKRIALGVRQDTVAYYRSRVPSRLWAPAIGLMRAMDGLYRLLARRNPTVVVGEAIAAQYPSRDTVLPITVSLIRDADIPPAVPTRVWGGRIELLTVGRIDREKNPLLLVEALARLEAAAPGRFRLTWVGRGALEDAVRSRAEALGVDRLIEFRGYVPFGEELFALYRGAHLFVHVSLTDGVPQTIVEALSLGTPVVATDVGGVRHMTGGGSAAILVPPSNLDALVDAVQRLIDDEELSSRLVARGLELARAVTFESESRRVAAFLGGRAGRDATAS